MTMTQGHRRNYTTLTDATGDNVALLTLARSARTSTEMIDRFYAKHLHAEMNVQQLQSMREGAKGRKARKSPDIAEKRETSAKKAKKGV